MIWICFFFLFFFFGISVYAVRAVSTCIHHTHH